MYGMGPSNAAARLLESVLNRYGSLEEFLIAVRADPRADTLILPALAPDRPRTARHRRDLQVAEPHGSKALTPESADTPTAGWGGDGHSAPIFVTGRHAAKV